MVNERNLSTTIINIGSLIAILAFFYIPFLRFETTKDIELTILKSLIGLAFLFFLVGFSRLGLEKKKGTYNESDEALKIILSRWQKILGTISIAIIIVPTLIFLPYAGLFWIEFPIIFSPLGVWLIWFLISYLNKNFLQRYKASNK